MRRTMRMASRIVCSLTSCLVLGVAAGAAAQNTTVRSGDTTVNVRGGVVQVQTPDGTTEVLRGPDGATSVRQTDAGTLLTELGARQEGDVIHLALAGDVLFDFGSARVTPSGEEVLTRVARVIRDRARGRVLVVGHTDAVGDEMANQRLSEARAASVARWLRDRAGVSAARLETRGLGESRPVAPNTTPDGRDDPQGRARNRRVEIYLGTTEGADVWQAAGLTTVSTGSGRVSTGAGGVSTGGVRIGNGTVDVGNDVHVEAGSVTVGGLRVTEDGVTTTGGAPGAAHRSGNVTCPAGRSCTADCPEGGCQLSCSAGAICTFGCLGGGCEMLCAAGANCTFSCQGGGCRFTRAAGSLGTTTCAGGGCTGG